MPRGLLQRLWGRMGWHPWGNIGVDARPLSARYLRREFAVEKKVVRATAYVCGLGFFDLYVNGKKVSDQVMNPALSDYRKAAYYVTFDITDQLKDDVNALGVVLGNGRSLRRDWRRRRERWITDIPSCCCRRKSSTMMAAPGRLSVMKTGH